jgi:hypothetical protein
VEDVQFGSEGGKSGAERANQSMIRVIAVAGADILGCRILQLRKRFIAG